MGGHAEQMRGMETPRKNGYNAKVRAEREQITSIVTNEGDVVREAEKLHSRLTDHFEGAVRSQPASVGDDRETIQQETRKG
jgi:hypothetical protein